MSKAGGLEVRSHLVVLPTSGRGCQARAASCLCARRHTPMCTLQCRECLEMGVGVRGCWIAAPRTTHYGSEAHP